MLDADRTPPEYSAAPDLREQVSAARDRISELLLVVVGISGALGLVTNLLIELVHTGTLTWIEWLTLTAAAAFTLVLALTAALRLRLSTREVDEEIELAFPLLVPTGASTAPLEMIEVNMYGAVTDLGHAAIAKLPSDQNAAIAMAARRIDLGASHTAPALALVPLPSPDDDAEDDETTTAALPTPIVMSDDPVLWCLQLAQLLVIAECLDESERLLGPQAIFHRGRWLRRRTPHLRSLTWTDLTATAGPQSSLLALRDLPGVRQRTTIPAAARLSLTDVAQELVAAKRRASGQRRSENDRLDEVPLVPLVRIAAGRSGWLTINGVGRVSAHAVPRYAQPGAGLTTRVFLRNARDNDLRRRALDEEALATLRTDAGVPRPGIRPPDVPRVQSLVAGADDLATEHARAWRALYRGARRPRVARVYLTIQGHFRIRLSGRRSIADQALYAWATALARRAGSMDVDAYMARLATRQQYVPQRRF